MSKNAFSNLRVYVSPVNRSKLVEWYLTPDFCPLSNNAEFYIESARALEDWLRLNPDDPVTDDNTYVDTKLYNYDLTQNLYYRVVLSLDGTEYTSPPVSVYGGLSLYESKVANLILTKELEKFKSEGSGTEGYLLKRRVWGMPCTSCKDYDLDAVIQSRCTLCYGTGIIGGYFNGFPFYMSFQADAPKQEELRPGSGLVDVRISQARCIAYPIVEPYDVWVAKNSNRRYVIRQVQTVAEIRSNPLVYMAALSEIMVTRPEFMVPIANNGIETDTPDSWRTGVVADY
jgi:hypothetical protein